MARGLSVHHCSPRTESLPFPLPNASPAVQRACGCQVSKPRSIVTVPTLEADRNLRSRLSGRPNASASLRHWIRSGHPITDKADRSSKVGEPRSLRMSANWSTDVSPVKQGSLWISSASTSPADHISTAGVYCFAPRSSSGARYQIVTTPGVSGRSLYALAIPKSASLLLTPRLRQIVFRGDLTKFQHSFRCEQYVLHLDIPANCKLSNWPDESDAVPYHL